MEISRWGEVHTVCLPNIWKYLKTFGNIKKCLEIFGIVWKFLSECTQCVCPIFGNIWKHLEIFRNISLSTHYVSAQYLAMFENIWKYLKISLWGVEVHTVCLPNIWIPLSPSFPLLSKVISPLISNILYSIFSLISNIQYSIFSI